VIGRKASNGQKKGEIKVHTQISLHETLPYFIWLSAATVHDKHFKKKRLNTEKMLFLIKVTMIIKRLMSLLQAEYSLL
jgi:hypothetical protein